MVFYTAHLAYMPVLQGVRAAAAGAGPGGVHRAYHARVRAQVVCGALQPQVSQCQGLPRWPPHTAPRQKQCAGLCVRCCSFHSYRTHALWRKVLDAAPAFLAYFTSVSHSDESASGSEHRAPAKRTCCMQVYVAPHQWKLPAQLAGAAVRHFPDRAAGGRRPVPVGATSWTSRSSAPTSRRVRRLISEFMPLASTQAYAYSWGNGLDSAMIFYGMHCVETPTLPGCQYHRSNSSSQLVLSPRQAAKCL